MLSFIFTDILMLSMGAIVYLVVRALPRVAEEPSDKKNLLDRWVYSEIPERVDRVINNFSVKFLKRTKVRILKLDNAVSKRLNKVAKKDDHAGNTAIDFGKIADEKKDDAGESDAA